MLLKKLYHRETLSHVLQAYIPKNNFFFLIEVLFVKAKNTGNKMFNIVFKNSDNGIGCLIENEKNYNHMQQIDEKHNAKKQVAEKYIQTKI